MKSDDYGRGVTAGKLEALGYSEKERGNYLKWIGSDKPKIAKELADAVASLNPKCLQIGPGMMNHLQGLAARLTN